MVYDSPRPARRSAKLPLSREWTEWTCRSQRWSGRPIAVDVAHAAVGAIASSPPKGASQPGRYLFLASRYEVTACGSEPGRVRWRQLTDRMRARQEPRGASIVTSSPTLRPMSACPTGESGDTPPTLETTHAIHPP